VVVHKSYDLQTLAALCRANLVTTAPGRCKRGADKACRFIQGAFVRQGIGKFYQKLPLYFASAPALKTPTVRR